MHKHPDFEVFCLKCKKEKKRKRSTLDGPLFNAEACICVCASASAAVLKRHIVLWSKFMPLIVIHALDCLLNLLPNYMEKRKIQAVYHNQNKSSEVEIFNSLPFFQQKY